MVNITKTDNMQKSITIEDFFEKSTKKTQYYQNIDYNIAKHQQEYGHKKFIKP
jgi:hypothetical protein